MPAYKSTFPLAAVFVALATLGSAQAAIVYQVDNTWRLGGLCPTCAGTASRIGDYIALGGTERALTSLSFAGQNFGLAYDANVQISFYGVDLSNPTPALGGLLNQVTQTVALPGAPAQGGGTAFTATIGLGGFVAPDAFIYTIQYLNNNSSTNWVVAGSFAGDSSRAASQVGTNIELAHLFGDWSSIFNDPNPLTLRRLNMASYQLGLPANSGNVANYFYTPIVTIVAANRELSVPGTLALAGVGLFAVGIIRRRALAR